MSSIPWLSLVKAMVVYMCPSDSSKWPGKVIFKCTLGQYLHIKLKVNKCCKCCSWIHHNLCGQNVHITTSGYGVSFSCKRTNRTTSRSKECYLFARTIQSRVFINVLFSNETMSVYVTHTISCTAFIADTILWLGFWFPWFIHTC